MKIHFLENKDYSPKAMEIYKSLTTEEITCDEEPDPKTELLITRLSPVTKEMIDSLPRLLFIAFNTTGQDHVDVSHAESKNIKCISLKGHTEFLKDIYSTAEHTMGLMIALLRQYKEAFNEFSEEEREEYKGHDLNGKTLGLVGYGRLANMVAKYAKAFGMKIIYTDSFDGWEKVLKESDIVSLHLPLDEKTKESFTYSHFQLMKPTAYFINTSRSQIVKEKALEAALHLGDIAGAATDFPEDGTGYLVEGKILTTPHIGGCTYESFHKTEQYLANLVKDHVNIL